MRKWKITSDDADNNNYQWQKTDEQQQQLVINSTSTLSKEGGVDNICSFSNSLFVTGSGKRVTISQNNLVKAKTLLGLNEDVDVSNTQTLQHAKKWHAVGETYERQSSPHLQLHKSVKNNRAMNAASCQNHSLGSSHTSKNDFQIEVGQTNMCTSGGKQPQTIFHTAGGRSIFVSNDALQRARSLLGDLDLGDFLDGGDVSDSFFSLPNQKQINTSSSCDRSDCDNPLVDQVTSDNNLMTKCFMSPLSSCRQKDTRFLCEGPANNLIQKFDAVGNENDKSLKSSIACEQKPLQLPDSTAYHSPLNGFSSKVDPLRMSSGRSLSGISNTNNNVHTNNRKQPASGKRRVGQYVMVSPFKKPRASKTSIPSNNNVGVFSNGFSQFSGDASVSKRKVSTLYPFRHPRMHIKHFFVAPSIDQKVHFTNLVRQMTSGNAEKYMFHEGYGEGGIGAEAFVNLLVQHGASMHFASKEWVLNHYKWIVWKLACYVRCCSARSAGNFLTVSNVLEELKYRYEREVNHGHRSTLKKILEGDALPSSMMVLCISSIHSNHGLENGTHSSESVTVELTDGWYSINAILDVPLSKQLACGKLFVGQKLRIWGAGLCGWNGPVSPLEVSSAVSLMLHINGTYRAHWADRLGFCKVSGPPLAFRCIKSNGGLIPQTLVGVTRIYPILYKERLSCGRSVVISERMENKMMELYNQRYSAAVEGIVSDYQKERRCSCVDESDSEAAKIYEMLETAEDPEFLMADMSLEQLTSFAKYKEKMDGRLTSHPERRCSCVEESDSEAAKIYEMLEAAEDPEFLMADMSLEQLKSFAKYKEKMDGRLTSHPERRCSCVDENDSEAAKIYEMLEAAEDPEFLMADMSLEQLKSFAKYKEKMDGRLTSHPERRCSCVDENDSEAAKIYEMLEAAEDPEFLMADMSLEQLKSFAHYEKKINAIKHSEKEKTIEKALKDAGLRNREVTPFMRLRVVGLTHKTRQDRPKDGIVTIWNPTDKQRQELVEGEAYAVAGLMPSDVDLDILHLQSRGSSTKWLPLSSNAKEQFKPFFSNRKSTSMSSLSYIPLSSEFDIAAHVVHVGEVYISSQQKKQWIFVTDGSIMHGLQSKTISLLAICFCSPSIDYDSFPPINYDLAGATVGFCNLIKREKDQTNHVWVADATENSTYCLSYESPHYAHLRNTASSIRRWANNSSLTIEMLKEKVLSMVGDFKE